MPSFLTIWLFATVCFVGLKRFRLEEMVRFSRDKSQKRVPDIYLVSVVGGAYPLRALLGTINSETDLTDAFTLLSVSISAIATYYVSYRAVKHDEDDHDGSHGRLQHRQHDEEEGLDMSEEVYYNAVESIG